MDRSLLVVMKLLYLLNHVTLAQDGDIRLDNLNFALVGTILRSTTSLRSLYYVYMNFYGMCY